MSIPLANVRMGQPIKFGSLTVFPLFCDEHRSLDYQLADEAMQSGAVTVGEISQQGSVPELQVANNGTKRVLFLEGEELRGAKQNRILNTSVLVPAQSQMKIPVSCVEQGRWRRTSASFSSSKQISPYRLRHSLKSSVTQSLKQKRGHHSDQGQVWQEVQKQQATLDVSSATSALADTYDKYEERVAEGQAALHYVPEACGLAVALGPRLISADLFDKPVTCEKVWSRLVSGLMLDALAVEGQADGSPDSLAVENLLQEIRQADWTATETVGEGQEFRAEFNDKVGSALVLDGALVHASVLI